MNRVEEIIKKFKEKPYLKRMGSGLIANRLHVSPEEVIKARKELAKITPSRPLKVLIFDIETAPMQAYVWGRWNQNISLDATISEWFIICWSAKWLYSNKVIGDVLTPEEIKQEDDLRIVKSLWELINKADVVVAHNGNKADIPWINTRFIIHGLNPPKPYFNVDTCLVARKQFNFSSNKLDALATYFGVSNKLDTNFELWKNCLKGCKTSLNYMLEYNKMDVKILEEVYLRLRPWIRNHPNMANIANIESLDDCCPFCCSSGLEEMIDEYYYTNVNKYKLYRCPKCGGISRGRKALSQAIKITNNLR